MSGIKRDPLRRTEFFVGRNEPDCFVGNITTGSVALCTVRSPEKTTVNEDAAALIPVSDQAAVLVVADGVGGMRGGAQASALAVESVARAVTVAAGENIDIRDAILNGIELANEEIRNLGIGAGSTIAVVEQNGGMIRTYHVGDSEIIIMGQRGRLIHQTIAHSPVGFAVEAGVLDAAEALHHEERHLLSNMLGAMDMRIVIGPAVRLARYDTVLLATDGLTDNLPLETIIEALRKGRLSVAVRRLFGRVLEMMENYPQTGIGKPDDLTLIVFRPYPLK